MNTNVEWEKLPYYGEVMRAKKREAREEGFQEGGVIALQGVLVDVLKDQFGHVPNRTVRAVQAIQKSGQLRLMVRKSLKAESLAEVQKLLLARKAKANGRNGHR